MMKKAHNKKTKNKQKMKWTEQKEIGKKLHFLCFNVCFCWFQVMYVHALAIVCNVQLGLVWFALHVSVSSHKNKNNKNNNQQMTKRPPFFSKYYFSVSFSQLSSSSSSFLFILFHLCFSLVHHSSSKYEYVYNHIILFNIE